jgi:hypothetical protein
MAQTPTAVRLFRRAWVRHHPAQPDFGDHGTAFGLDLSMTPPEDAAEPPAPPRSPVREAGFWRRLADRRRDPTG